MKSVVLVPDNIKLIEQSQIMTLSPAERDKYYSKVIIDILRTNPEGVTAPELEEATGFYGRTVRDHLKRLVASGEAGSISRGKLTIYQPIGQSVKKPQSYDSRIRPGSVYVVNKLRDRNNNQLIYIQEKELDGYRTLRVKGGITIHRDDVKDLLKLIHTYSLEGDDDRE